jgi:ribosomal protein S18 acetylase RimI-like enzyme
MAGQPVRPNVVLKVEPELSGYEFVDVLHRSGLSERRPVGNPAIIRGMLEHADLIVTARTVDGLLVGVARSISDFHYCTYLSDLAVDASFQRQGIGRQLIDYTHEQAGRNTSFILLSAPAASTYYPHVGLSKHDSCWIIPRVD